MEFTVTETGKTIKPRNEGVRPIIFITSNSERRLPEPFLRRCVYHHIRFSEEIIIKAVESRRAEYEDLDQDFLDVAVQRFLALRQRNLRKRPSTGELLIGLFAAGQLPLLGVERRAPGRTKTPTRRHARDAIDDR